MSRIYHTLGQVLENQEIEKEVHLLTLQAPEIARDARPGQFVHIRVTGSYDPLLRRPFSFHWVGEENFGVLYQVVGRGTKFLSQVRPGDSLDLLGPLGRGFDLNSASSPLIVAGGLGVAPLLFLAQRLARNRPTVLIGAPTKKQILGEQRMRALAAEVRTATEDGSSGTKGVVTDLLASVLRTDHSVFACGPREMLRAVAGICQKKGCLSSQISLEEIMGCGLGACLGCGVKSSRGGYRRVCSEGPVFYVSEVIL